MWGGNEMRKMIEIKLKMSNNFGDCHCWMSKLTRPLSPKEKHNRENSNVAHLGLLDLTAPLFNPTARSMVRAEQARLLALPPGKVINADEVLQDRLASR